MISVQIGEKTDGLFRSAVFVRSTATKSTKRDYAYWWGNVSRADGSHTAPSYITITISSLAGTLLVILRCRPRNQELSSALTSRCHDLWTTPPTHNIS